MIRQGVYVSTARAGAGDAELHGIVDKARAANGRNGLTGLAQCIEMHAPLALVVLMLGTNDFQSMHPHTAWHSAQGIAALVAAIRSA